MYLSQICSSDCPINVLSLGVRGDETLSAYHVDWQEFVVLANLPSLPSLIPLIMLHLLLRFVQLKAHPQIMLCDTK